MNFIVFSHARSGSNWIVRYLGSSELIRCYGELFRGNYLDDDPGAVKLVEETGYSRESLSLIRHSNPTQFLNIIQDLASNKKLVGGFKLFPYHLAHSAISNVLETFKPVVIVLFRDNMIDGYASLKLAEATGFWHSREYGDVLVDFDEEDYIRWRSNLVESFGRSLECIKNIIPNERILETQYELLLSSKKDFMDKVASHMSLSFNNQDFKFVEPEMKKQCTSNALPFRCSSRIENYRCDKMSYFLGR
jgi:hypothetical protein